MEREGPEPDRDLINRYDMHSVEHRDINSYNTADRA